MHTKQFYIFSFSLLCVFNIGFAQEKTNILELQKLAVEFSKISTEVDLFIKAQKNNKVEPQKDELWLHRLNSLGEPMYYALRSNITAAKNIQASKLWTGGALNLTLNGQGMEVNADRARLGVWEPGLVRLSHSEFGNRIKNRDGQTFPTSNNNNDRHATHVSGTILGNGTDNDAKGMAWQARMDAYNAANDLEEMAIAASEGMLISNHSYGPVYPGIDHWSLGYYDQEAKNWDMLAYNAPYYLMVQACGNDRKESSGIKYDILIGSSTSKNTLQVAAVNLNNSPTGYQKASDVIMTDFSSFGPTDDGRIKPDIAAPGYLIYSASNTSDNDYAYLSGTSMAGAVVTGGAFLLQQFYKSLSAANNFLFASSLKALIIHTADEAGDATGPDYRFGWGVINLEKAVFVLTKKDGRYAFSEERLENSVSVIKEIYVNGDEDLRITICWTDPAAIPFPVTTGTEQNTAKNNRTSRLVNDLDLRVYDESGNLLDLPWKLDPWNPNNPATKGDNTVDNVEQILVPKPKTGKYKIIVSHKNSLSGGNPQAFALVMSGISQNLITGQESTLEAGLWEIFPNPTTDYLNLTAPESSKEIQMVIFDAQGAKIKEYTFKDVEKNEDIKIETSYLTNNLYFIRIISDNQKTYTYQFIKE